MQHCLEHSVFGVDLSLIPSVCLCIWKVYCGKMADSVRMPFGMVSRVCRGMCVLGGGDDRQRRRGNFGNEFAASYCTITNGDFVE